MSEKQRALDRAQQARDILDNPMFDEAWVMVEKHLIDQMYALRAKDSEESYKMIVALQQLKGVKVMLEKALEEGEIAKTGFFK